MKIALAYLMLVGFVPFALVMFKRLPKPLAAAVVVIFGSIMLPEKVAIDLPAVPPIDKEYLTYLMTLIAAAIYCRGTLLKARPGRGLESIVFVTLLANIGTAYMNPTPMWDEGILEDGLGPYWVIVRTSDDILTLAVPYFVGRALFTSLNDLYIFMRTLALAAAAYTGLIFIEVVLSVPFRSWQLSAVLYDLPMRVNMRWGFAQPVLFFDNGLALATFMAVALIASAGIAKAGLPMPRVGANLGLPRFGASWVRNLLAVGLTLTLNVAGNVYGHSFLLAHLFLRARIVLLGGVSLIILGCVYPSLRMADLFPYEAIVDFAAQYDGERAHSLEGRFFEEEHVLGQIGDRLWLGWGTISRTPGAETFGQGELGLDGWWTIQLGSNGILGVLLYYSMFALPVFLGLRRLRLADRPGQILLGSMVCMIALRMIDLIINGWWNSLPIFLAGILTGVSSNLKRGSKVIPTAAGRKRPPRPLAIANPASNASLLTGADPPSPRRRTF